MLSSDNFYIRLEPTIVKKHSLINRFINYIYAKICFTNNTSKNNTSKNNTSKNNTSKNKVKINDMYSDIIICDL